MDQFIENIKCMFFPHTNVKIYANNSRLVIELKKREIFSYYPKKGKLIINDPIPIVSGYEIQRLYETARIGGVFDGEE